MLYELELSAIKARALSIGSKLIHNYDEINLLKHTFRMLSFRVDLFQRKTNSSQFANSSQFETVSIKGFERHFQTCENVSKGKLSLPLHLRIDKAVVLKWSLRQQAPID